MRTFIAEFICRMGITIRPVHYIRCLCLAIRLGKRSQPTAIDHLGGRAWERDKGHRRLHQVHELPRWLRHRVEKHSPPCGAARACWWVMLAYATQLPLRLAIAWPLIVFLFGTTIGLGNTIPASCSFISIALVPASDNAHEPLIPITVCLFVTLDSSNSVTWLMDITLSWFLGFFKKLDEDLGYSVGMLTDSRPLIHYIHTGCLRLKKDLDEATSYSWRPG